MLRVPGVPVGSSHLYACTRALGKWSDSTSSSRLPMPLPVPPAMLWVNRKPCRLSASLASRSAASPETLDT